MYLHHVLPGVQVRADKTELKTAMHLLMRLLCTDFMLASAVSTQTKYVCVQCELHSSAQQDRPQVVLGAAL